MQNADKVNYIIFCRMFGFRKKILPMLPQTVLTDTNCFRQFSTAINLNKKLNKIKIDTLNL